VGGTCVLSSDCKQGLVCTWGKCHDACHTSVDCPLGQSCVKTALGPVCQLPGEADCRNTSCGSGLVCASDLRCRSTCPSAAGCIDGQVCVGGVCADPGDLEVNGQLPLKDPNLATDAGQVSCSEATTGQVGGSCVVSSDCSAPLECIMGKCHGACQSTADCPVGQNCVRTNNTTVCQLPDEADCTRTMCNGAFVCASDLRCRTTCLSFSDCASGQVCVNGVCADPIDLKTDGQLPQKGPSLAAIRMPDAGSNDTRADVPAGLVDGAAGGSGGVVGRDGGPGTGGVTATGGALIGHYQMENLDRGVVAVKISGGVYVGWRMLGTEYDTTASNVAYNLYRDGTKVASVTDSTNYLDAAGTATSKYSLSPVIKGTEGAQSAATTPWAQNYLSIPLTPPLPGPNGGIYSANDASPGDLDGDGQYEIVLKWDPSNSKDSAVSGVTDTCILDGVKLDGTRLWRIDVGQNIRAGAHDTQFSVYDFDGDGKAEVAFKTAPGTKDGKGNFLTKGPAAGADNGKDYRTARGMALEGPEWLTVFSGVDGSELATIEYPVLYASTASWGDSTGNRSHRYNGGAAFVKEGGVANGLPSIIQQRGYYTRLTVSALTFRGGVLAKNWVFDSNGAANGAAAGQGCHSCMAADVDNDGAQEIIPGSSTINSDGSLKCTTALGHGDALHVGALVIGKGISVFTIHEEQGGYDVHDGATCTPYVSVTNPTVDNARGVADDIDPSNPGAEMWSKNYTDLYSCANGSSIGTAPDSLNFLIYWDADESRELEDATSITKYGGGTLLSCTDCASNNGTRATPTLTADLLGDWREEIVWRTADDSALRVYTTTAVTKRRIYTLMHDPTYRAQVSFEQSGYNQPPHTGFPIGAGMANPPKPDIYVK
jgi:hypothetical protein